MKMGKQNVFRITRRELAGVALTPVATRLASASAAKPRNGAGPGAAHFPNVTLRTHEDREVRLYDDLVKGNTVLLTFMYATCEGICPATILNLRKVQQRFGDRMGRDVFMYSITIKPEVDTPAVLKSYAEMHGAERGWLFLTGNSGDIDLVRRTLGFVDRDPVASRNASSHIGMILYGREPLDRWASCPALGDPEQIYKSVLWLEGAMPGVPAASPAQSGGSGEAR
jgi:protein SCO1/2